jgi:segregation and condensation protein B
MQQSEETREAATGAEISEQEAPNGNQSVPAAEAHVDDKCLDEGHQDENRTDEQPRDEERPDEDDAKEERPDAELDASEELEEQPATLFVAEAEESAADQDEQRNALKAVIEAAIYITDEPLTPDQIAKAIDQPLETVKEILAQLVAEYGQPDRGLTVRELAGGYKMGTKPEHHESIRQFVKKLQPPLKLSLPALETLAVIAYKQPITAPEIMDIRGVQGAGVLKTLLDRRLIAAAGRKDVVGKPIMYKTTKEFLIQFGLSSLKELPTLKEFEELGRMALTDETPEEPQSPFESAPALTESAPENNAAAENNQDAEQAEQAQSEESPQRERDNEAVEDQTQPNG